MDSQEITMGVFSQETVWNMERVFYRDVCCTITYKYPKRGRGKFNIRGMVKCGMMGYYIVIKMLMKKFLVTWGNTNVVLNRKYIKYTQYDLIIVKRYMQNLYVYTNIWKCHQYINSVSLFGDILLSSLYFLHCLC